MEIQRALEVSNDASSNEASLIEAYNAAKAASNTGEVIAKKIFANLASRNLPMNLVEELINTSTDPSVFENLSANQKLTTNVVKTLYEKVSSRYKSSAHEDFAKLLKSRILTHPNLGKAMLNFLARSDKTISNLLERQPLRPELYLKFLKEGDEVVRKLICQNTFLKEDIIQKLDLTPEVQEGLKIREAKLKSLEISSEKMSSPKQKKVTTKTITKTKEGINMSDVDDEDLSFFGEMKAIAGETLLMSAAATANEFAVDGIMDLAQKFGVSKELLASPAFRMIIKPALPALLMLGASSQEDFISEHLGETVLESMQAVFGAALEEANVESMNTVLEAVVPALKELVSSGQLQLAESKEEQSKMLNEAVE